MSQSVERMENNPFKLDKVAIRMVHEPPLFSDYPLDKPEAVVKLMADTLRDYDREVFAVINLRSDLAPINLNIVSMGALNQSLVHPREVLKTMILSNAAAVMLVHNHTSGKLVPSNDDIMTTDRLAKVCELVGIRLMDHVIVGPGKAYFSFSEKSILPLPSMKYETNLDDLTLGGLKVAEATMEQQKDKLSAEQYREMKEAELKDIMEKLEQGVADVFSSNNYKLLLDTMAKFPRYSVNNNILIMMQRPDATMCQSFTGWKEMGRFVKKGEKGISIIAPAPYTIQKEQPRMDKNGTPVLGKDGEPIMDNVEIKVNGFKVAKTFDVSQTDGKEIPTLGVNELSGSVEGFNNFLEALTMSCPVPIEFEKIKGEGKGYFSLTDNRIAIQEGMSEVQTIKTIIHEMAHQKMHTLDKQIEGQTRNSKEVEAESVAYTVCQHYEIDTSDYSFSYVAGWSEGKEMPELKASLDTIRRAASEMITAIDKSREEIVLQMTQEQMPEFLQGAKTDTEPKKDIPDRAEALKQLVNDTAKKVSSEKTEKKPSVRAKIQEGKEKAAKTPVKPSKDKVATARE